MSKKLSIYDSFSEDILKQNGVRLQQAGHGDWVERVLQAASTTSGYCELSSEQFDGQQDLLAVAIDYASRAGVTLIIKPKSFHRKGKDA